MQHTIFNVFRSILQTAHWLSLDVVLGAISLHLAFSKLPLGTPISWTTTTNLLALSVWAIYLLDRLLDNRKPEENQTKRHEFHLTYQFNLSLLLLLIVIVCSLLLFIIPIEVLYFGLTILLGVCVYFFFVHSYLTNKRILFWVKTWGIAVIYPIAVVGSTFISQSSINLSSWILAALVALICLQNLLLFAYFEQDPSPKREKTIRYIAVFALFIWIFLFYGSVTYTSFLAGILVGISITYSIIPLLYKRLIQRENYRWVIDSLFIMSLLSLIF